MTTSHKKERKKRFLKLYARLEELFPVKVTELEYTTPWELLVAVILSAQCTDAQVNKVTKKLFKKYITLEDYISADPKAFARDIYSTGFYKNKTKNILAAAKTLKEKYDGVIPKTIAEAIQLPGVGRKTANVVLQNLYGINEGIAVDTHVQRFAVRYDLSDFKDARRIEEDLMEIVPQRLWRDAGYYIKQYGRTFSPARNWNRSKDPLQKIFKTEGVA